MRGDRVTSSCVLPPGRHSGKSRCILIAVRVEAVREARPGGWGKAHLFAFLADCVNSRHTTKEALCEPRRTVITSDFASAHISFT